MLSRGTTVLFSIFLSYSDRVFRFVALMLVVTAGLAQSDADAIKITMERKASGMNLSTPQYKLTLRGDGSIVFEGRARVAAKGLHKGKIQPTAVEELANRFKAIHYFDLPHRLGSCTDAATVVTSVSVGNLINEVRNWECGTTPALSALEDEIDRVSNSKVWIRGRIRLWLHWPWFHSRG